MINIQNRLVIFLSIVISNVNTLSVWHVYLQEPLFIDNNEVELKDSENICDYVDRESSCNTLINHLTSKLIARLANKLMLSALG